MEIECDMISGGCNAVYNGIQFCSDKRYSHLVVYSCANQVFVYDSLKIKVLCTLSQFEQRVNSAKFFNHKDELRIAAVSDDGIICQWILKEGQWVLGSQAKITNQKLEQLKIISGQFIVLGTDGVVYLLDENFNKLTTLEFGNNVMECVDAVELQGATILALSGQDKGIHIYEYTMNKLQFKCTLKGHQRNVNTLSFQVQDDKLLLASGGKDNQIRLWQFKVNDHDFSEVDQKKGFKRLTLSNNITYIAKLESILSGHIEEVSSICWDKESQLYSASFDYNIIIWKQDKESGVWLISSRLGQVQGNKNQFFGVCNSLDNSVIAHTFDGGIFLWKTQELIEYPTITGHYSSVTDLDVSKNGYIVSCSLDQTTRIWSPSIDNIWYEVSRPQVHGYDINAIKFLHRDDNVFETLVSGGDEKVIRLFTPTPMSANFIRVISHSECVLPQGELTQQNIYKVGSECVSQPLGLMNKQIFEENEEFIQQDEEVQIDLSKVQFDQPPTHQLLNARGLWPELNKLYGHGYEVLALATHNNLIASSCKSTSEDAAQIILWDNFKIIGSLRSHQSSVVQMQFSTSGEYLVSASKDRTISLFKRSGQIFDLVARSEQAARIVYTCTIDPLERFIVTGSRDKKVRVYLMNLEKIFEKNLGAPVTASGITKLPNDCYLLILGFENGNIQLYSLEIKDNAVNLNQLEKVPLNYKHNQQVNRIKIIKTKGFNVQFCSCSDDHTVRIFSIKQ